MVVGTLLVVLLIAAFCFVPTPTHDRIYHRKRKPPNLLTCLLQAFVAYIDDKFYSWCLRTGFTRHHRPRRPTPWSVHPHHHHRRRRYCTPRHKRKGTRVGCKNFDEWSGIYAFMAKVQRTRPSPTTHPARNTPQTTTFDTESFDIRIDNHSSYSVTPSKSDFVGPLQPMRAKLMGMGGTTTVRYKGTVRWRFDDDLGESTEHLIHDTLYIPTAPDRILSPQHWGQQRRDTFSDYAYVKTDPVCVQIVWDHGAHTKTVPLDPLTNVATMKTSPSYGPPLATYNNVISDDERSIHESDPHVDRIDPDDDQPPSADTAPADVPGPSDDQVPVTPHPITFDTRDSSQEATHLIPAEFECIDQRENPRSLLLRWHHRLQHLAFTRLRKLSEAGFLPKSLLGVRKPICVACSIGRATKRPWRTKGIYKPQSVPNVTAPGDCVSVDQMQSTTPGLIPQLRGFITKRRYEYATIYVDHKSSLSFVYLQESSKMDETIRGKEAFEAYARARGVIIRHYHADNGRFAERGWVNHVSSQGQTISFCGVNAHHQNGVAEKRIRDLQEAVRSVLIHARQRWPDAIETYLWPFALTTVNHAHNHTISMKTGEVPIQSFSQLEERSGLKHFHTFGCPAYVLSSDLQSGKTQNKWQDRASASINLGPSPKHGNSVSLLLNLQTGMITPQFHVKFDDFFDTTRADASFRPPKSLWQSKTYFRNSKGKSSTPSASESTNTLAVPPTGNGNVTIDQMPSRGPPASGDRHRAQSTVDDHATEPTELHAHQPTNPIEGSAETTTTRSGRAVRPPSRFLESLLNVANYDGTYELLEQERHPLVSYLASANPDILYLDQAMKASDADEFRKAMVKEVRDHETRRHWELIPKSSVPEGATILPSVWSMRRKRVIQTGEIYKWKSRLTVGGHKQRQGIDYDQTYSPVVSWPIIRLFLVFFLIERWVTRQLDFVLAYPQAKVERDMYLEIPRGFSFNGSRSTHVLKLIQNMYGARQAGRQWYLHVTKYLTDLGFVQSTIDPCVFYLGASVVLLLFVDDVILGARNDDSLNEAIELLHDNVDVEDQGDISDYLGVHVHRHDQQTLELSQPHLIQSILDDLRLTSNSKTAPTPAKSTTLLHADLDGDDFDGHFNYRSVIGKLNYLEKSTRLDLGYAVHQCARFVSNPKMSHAMAVKRIGRYLLGTKTRGYIMRPDTSRSFECFVDASFAGEWIKENSAQAESDPNTARSRTGYVILFAGIPLTWGSKLQTEIALSSTEAEMIALSTATRENIHILRLIADAKTHGINLNMSKSKIHCKVLEDNMGTVAIASEPRIRPRTKHINTKYWHFVSFLRENLMSIEWVSTKDQLADLLTKPLAIEPFRRFVSQICGWVHDSNPDTSCS